MQAGHRHHPIPLTCISGGKSNISSIEIEALLFGFSGAACWNRGRVPYLDLLAADSGNKKLYILELPSLFDCDLTERQAGAFQEEIFFRVWTLQRWPTCIIYHTFHQEILFVELVSTV